MDVAEEFKAFDQGYVIINQQGKYAMVTYPASHLGLNAKIHWVNDINHAEVRSKYQWAECKEQYKNCIFLMAKETRTVTLLPPEETSNGNR